MTIVLYSLINNFAQTLNTNNFLYPQTKAVTTYLYTDARTRNISTTFSITAGGGDQYYTYEGIMYWFFQEYMYHQQVIHLTDWGKTFTFPLEKPDYIYLVCRTYFERTIADCQHPFEEDNPTYIVQEKLMHPFGNDYQLFLYKRSDL
jgi:hypothetical protein